MEKKRTRNRGTGAALLAISVLVLITYAYFLLASQWSMLVLQFTVLGGVAVLLTVLGWIGYTMLTAPGEEGRSSA